MTGENETLIADIEREMEGRARGYADVRGELLFRCLDALSRPSPVVGEGAVAWRWRFRKSDGEYAIGWQITRDEPGPFPPLAEDVSVEVQPLYAAPSTIQTGDDRPFGLSPLEQERIRSALIAGLEKAYWAGSEVNTDFDALTEADDTLAALASPLVGSGQGSFSQEAKIPTEGQEAAVVGPDSLSAEGKFFMAVDHLTRMTWRWGESCGIDNVSWDETGDSYNQTCRAGHRTARRAVVEAFHAAVAEKACQQAAVSAAEQVGTQSPLGDGVNPTPSQQQEPGQ